MKGGRLRIRRLTNRMLPEARPFYLVVLDIMGVEGYELLKPERRILVFIWILYKKLFLMRTIFLRKEF
jgi:hypothetical protein